MAVDSRKQLQTMKILWVCSYEAAEVAATALQTDLVFIVAPYDRIKQTYSEIMKTTPRWANFKLHGGQAS